MDGDHGRVVASTEVDLFQRLPNQVAAGADHQLVEGMDVARQAADLARLGRGQAAHPLQVDDVVDASHEGEQVAALQALIRGDGRDGSAVALDLDQEHALQLPQPGLA